MVKAIFRIVKKKKLPKNNVRITKRTKKDIDTKKTQKITHDFASPNDFPTNSPNLKYDPKDRQFILFGIIDLFEKVNELAELPEDLLFSLIAFFDKYLEKTEKTLTKKEMVSALYACLDILDKEQNINIFTHPNFKSYYTPQSENEILETVDLEVYPEKLYDHFQKFYYHLAQNHQHNPNFMGFLKNFKNSFKNFGFFLVFNDESLKHTPISNFISCLILSYEKCKSYMPGEEKILKDYIDEIKAGNKYSKDEYSISKRLIDESIYNFNSLLYRITK